MTEMVETQQKLTWLTASDIKAQVQLIQEVMDAVMQDGHHYGTIPGTPKPTLLKPGAEKLGLTFRLRPEYDILPQSLLNEEVRTYRLKCRLVHIHTGESWGEGVGSCSSHEKKYFKQMTAESERTIEDLDNTIFKMAAKRAHVAAILSATAASDIFTQDAEEMDAGQLNGAGATQPRVPFGDHKGKTPKELTTEQLCQEQARFQELADDPTNKYRDSNRKLVEAIKTELASRPVGAPTPPYVKGDANLFEGYCTRMRASKDPIVIREEQRLGATDQRLSLDQMTAINDLAVELLARKK